MSTALPRVLVPKPSRVAGWVRARVEPPRIGDDTVRRVLCHHQLELVGRPANLSLSWRNRLLVIDTSAGRFVLKQYRETSNVDTITHEHSIFGHLEKRGFPAVRLRATPAGATVVDVDGGLFTLFFFERGRTIAASFLSKHRRREIVGEAGRMLGRLHIELDGFRPAGAHHLGLDPVSGEGKRDLVWHLEALECLAQGRPNAATPEAVECLEWLCSSSTRVRDELQTVGTDVEAARLPTGVIHGDYGTHNLLFRSDGTAVVHDFELARLDRRLLDLVIASVRLMPENHAVFLSGYREEHELPETELALLPALWRFHLLSGAIRSWHGYTVFGGTDRLLTARSRIAAVEAGPTGVIAQWS